jgi:NAD(P)-dependent dehydrogenase (short-subunit alcohol dehydrogenase family)
MSNPFDLTGHRVLVTGASSGIGRATAITLNRLGAQVILVARNEERLQDTLDALEPPGHVIEPFDLTSIENIPQWMKNVAQRQGKLSGLVHCAGVEAISPLRFQTLEKFRSMHDINVTSALWLLKGFRQKGVSGPGGSVVLISSIAGLVGQSGHAAYCATKGALIALVRAAAVELAPEGMRVNCIAPGRVEGTAMTTAADGHLSEDQTAAIKALHPLDAGTVFDVANGIAFLLAEAARWITGTTLVIDGGYTAQ